MYKDGFFIKGPNSSLNLAGRDLLVSYVFTVLLIILMSVKWEAVTSQNEHVVPWAPPKSLFAPPSKIN